MKIAIPTINGTMSQHFGHSDKFYIAEISDNKIINEIFLSPPPHEFGVFPKWLASEGVNVLLCGGIGHKAIQIFEQFGVKVISGVSGSNPTNVVTSYLENSLVATGDTCSGGSGNCH